MWKRCSVRLQQGKKGPFDFTEKGEYSPIRYRYADARIAQGVTTNQTDITSRDYAVRSPDFNDGYVRQVSALPADSHAKPTHFLSLRVPQGSTFTGAFRDIHKLTKDFNEKNLPLFVPLQKLHLTLSVATIDPAHVSGVVDHIGGLLESYNTEGPLSLRLRGLGHFHDRVVFAKVSAELGSSNLHSMVEHLRAGLGKLQVGEGGRLVSSSNIAPVSMAAVNLRSNPRDGYVPHVTVAKVRPHQQKAFNNKVPRSLWAPIQFDDFGDVTFSAIDLCEMAGDPKSGYYKVVKSFTL